MRVGDTVVIQRAGDVIPQIVGVVEAKRPKGAKPLQLSRPLPGLRQPCRARGERDHRQEDVVRRCTGGLICPAQRSSGCAISCRATPSTSRASGDKHVEAFFRRRAARNRRRHLPPCRGATGVQRRGSAAKAGARPRRRICSLRSRRAARSRSTASSMRSASGMSARSTARLLARALRLASRPSATRMLAAARPHGRGARRARRDRRHRPRRGATPSPISSPRSTIARWSTSCRARSRPTARASRRMPRRSPARRWSSPARSRR